jgi:hypothetical protein
MKPTQTDALPPDVLASRGERFTAGAVAGSVIILFVFFAVFLLRNMVPLQAELDLMAARALLPSPALSVGGVIWEAWGWVAGSTLGAARLLSVLVAVAAVVVFLDLVRIISQDICVPPFLALAFVMFPPLVATLSAATPHGLMVVLMLGALRLLCDPKAKTPNAVLAGVLCAVASLLTPLGAAIVAIWLVYCGVLIRAWQGVVIGLAAVAVSSMLAAGFGLIAPTIDTALATKHAPTVLQTTALPYAMLPTAALLSALALFSPRVRSMIGVDRAVVVILGPFVALGFLLVARHLGFLQTTQFTTAVAACLPLLLFAAWPLVVWARHVMPQIKSFWAWVAFPVVMYSCFWVVLGPVKSDRFPYTHLRLAQPG